MNTLSRGEYAQQSRAGTAARPAQIVLRDAVAPQDRDAIQSLVTRTGFFRPDEIAIAAELVEERLAKGAASGYEFLLAESDGELIGYACYGPIACTIGSYDLFWIVVDPRFQRNGVGRQLVASVESRVAAAGGRRIYIDTSGQSKYAPTRAFYERSGYRLAAQLADFYAPGDDRVIYVRSVT
ncbi:MAG: GNAT family N-acetyltransferase [Pirellulales bacterium]